MSPHLKDTDKLLILFYLIDQAMLFVDTTRKLSPKLTS